MTEDECLPRSTGVTTIAVTHDELSEIRRCVAAELEKAIEEQEEWEAREGHPDQKAQLAFYARFVPRLQRLYHHVILKAIRKAGWNE